MNLCFMAIMSVPMPVEELVEREGMKYLEWKYWAGDRGRARERGEAGFIRRGTSSGWEEEAHEAAHALFWIIEPSSRQASVV